ncbi:non-ribosomal peptide synthetase [Dactylosporangium sp. NPDC000555]|uniref:non-ribosomal peptide synthetase n=1 Tax=Dactylosporangium sp. NPDC000555 TaxID=3154260 RepID=UPI0033204F50
MSAAANRLAGTFPQLFEDVVARRADTVAVVGTRGRLTYAQLAGRSRRVARGLIAKGVGPEDVVAVVADRSTDDWLVAILGVLLSGGGYLAIDPAYPAERVSFMLSDAAPKLVLVPAPLDWDAGLPSVVIEAVIADEPDDSAIRPAERTAALAPDNLAYLIYTSGSTGTPKGVAVTHAGLAALAATQRRVIGTGPSDQVLQWASPSFDAAFWDVTLALLHGATLHLAAPEQLLPGEPLAETLRRRGITCATLPPVALAALDAGGDLLAGRTVVSTGDTCTRGIVDGWARGRRLINGYGPTETTVGATLSAPLVPGVPAHIGTPFDGARVDVVDGALDEVPSGAVGEFLVAGPGVARGYHRRPRLTAERFRPDPRGTGGQRAYLTGDLGCRRTDGRLQFAGRRDDQVKIRGFRVELGEIEATLAQHPDVLAAAVAVRPIGDGPDTAILAWVTTASGRTDAGPLRRYLAQRLPRHLVPAVISALPDMPTNAHGKIDRAALPTPNPSALLAEPAPGAAAPEEDEVERSVRALFEESLQMTNLAPDDNFFDLGGDSIRYTRLISRLNRQLEVRLPLKEAFLGASPRAVARLARSAVPTG